jgi:hypothetical protein
MIRPVLASAAVATILSLSCSLSGLARGNDLTVTTGHGEEIQIKNGFFGRRNVEIKDRLGDKYVQKKGFFGSKETSVNLFGNQIQKKKGWFGGSDISGQDILGDKVTTKKGIFGRRTTTVDVSGAASLIQNLFSDKKPLSQLPQLPLDARGKAIDALTPLGGSNEALPPPPSDAP